MSQHSRILLGAMSGTSADGVDVASVEVSGRGWAMQAKYLGHVEHAYDAELRRRIFALRESGSCRLDELAKLGRDITLAYAEATSELMRQMSLAPSRIEGLAAHGQTLYHAPPDSIQWLDPSLLAAKTEIAVISDFRRADLAAGGQGAPLVPFADWILFRHPEKTRVILNIGGIANLTYLPAGGGIDEVIAFDTGPGMCVSDWLMRQHDPEGAGFDEGGRIAETGQIPNPDFPSHLMLDEFFDRHPPKSTDGPSMIGIFTKWQARDAPEAELRDLLNTACFWTVAAIEHGTGAFFNWEPDELIVAGGGTRNRRVMEWLTGTFRIAQKHGLQLRTMDNLHVPVQAREAVAFAILGAATLDGEPSNVPSATGASKRVVLGSITSRPGT